MVAMEQAHEPATTPQPQGSTDQQYVDIESRLGEAHRTMSAFAALRDEIKRLRAALTDTRALWEIACAILDEDTRSNFTEAHDPIALIDEALAPVPARR